MVLPEQRARLSKLLDQYLAGLLTTSAFANRAGEWSDSQDKGLALIAEGCFGLDDDLIPNWWSHCDSLSPDARRWLRNCRLFLSSGMEYEWPDERGMGCLELLFGMIHASAVILSPILSLVAIVVGVLAGPFPMLLTMTAPVGLIAAGVFGYRQGKQRERRRCQEFESAGDYSVWPFLRRADYERTQDGVLLASGHNE